MPFIFSYGSKTTDAVDGGTPSFPLLSTVSGDVTNPAFSWSSATNTGFYLIDPDEICLTLAGNLRWQWRTSTCRGPNGAASSPTYSFSNSTQTGMYKTGDAASLSSIGQEGLRVDNNSTAKETALLVSQAGGAVQRVSVGANDSGDVGFSVLQVPN